MSARATTRRGGTRRWCGGLEGWGGRERGGAHICGAEGVGGWGERGSIGLRQGRRWGTDRGSLEGENVGEQVDPSEARVLGGWCN